MFFILVLKNASSEVAKAFTDVFGSASSHTQKTGTEVGCSRHTRCICTCSTLSRTGYAWRWNFM